MLGKVQGVGSRWRQAFPQKVKTDAKSGLSKQLLIDSSTSGSTITSPSGQPSPPSVSGDPSPLDGETRPALPPYQRVCSRKEAQRCPPSRPAASRQSVQTQLTRSYLHTPPGWAAAGTRTPSTVSLGRDAHEQGWKAQRLLGAPGRGRVEGGRT